LADTEEMYLIPEEEAEAERIRIKANKLKVVSRFKAGLCREADDEVQIAGELNTE
jgi:hypothetical protein